MNNLYIILSSLIAAGYSPVTGDNIMWIIPAAAVSLILIILLVIFGKKRPPRDD